MYNQYFYVALHRAILTTLHNNSLARLLYNII